MSTTYMNPKANCAGQECDERTECLRYMEERPYGRTAEGYPLVAWASFDIERQQQGSCKSFIQWRGA